MQIHVARHASQLGVFSPEEVTDGLISGRFQLSDLAWCEGLTGWKPLGDWSEFRGVVPPPLSGSSKSANFASEAGLSSVPWEQGRSLRTFLATFRGAIVSPSSTLAVGRYGLGDWILFSYFALLLGLPFQILGILVGGDQNAQLGELMIRFGLPQGQALADQPAAPIWLTVILTAFGLFFVPLVYAAGGVVHWLGQRLFRYPVPLERTLAAVLLASSVIGLLLAPLRIFSFSIFLYMALLLAAVVPTAIVYYRALGGATGISAWMQFVISSVIWTILFCCCCVLPLSVMFFFAGGMTALQSLLR